MLTDDGAFDTVPLVGFCLLQMLWRDLNRVMQDLLAKLLLRRSCQLLRSNPSDKRPTVYFLLRNSGRNTTKR